VRFVPTIVAAGFVVAACGGSVDDRLPKDAGGGPPTETDSGELRLEADHQLDPDSIVFLDGSIYWSNRGTNVDNEFPHSDGSLVKLPIDGSGELEVVAEGGSPQPVVTDGDYVYWADGESIWRAHRDGGQPVHLTDSWTWSLTIGKFYVYYVAKGIWRVYKDGGAPELIASSDDAGNPRRLAVDDTHVYWADYDAGSIARATKTGGAAEVVVSNQDHPWAVALSETTLYWSNVSGVGVGPGHGSVLSMPKAAGAPTGSGRQWPTSSAN